MNKPIHFVTNKLREYREAKGWTQSDLAEFLTLQMNTPVSRETVIYWEGQKRGLVAETALEVSRATKIPVSELFERKDGETNN